MSIIYEGLNPKNHYGLCILTKDGELITADGKHYQAIQIPKNHGDIKDVSRLWPTVIEKLEYGGSDGRETYHRKIEVYQKEDIDNAPTILDKERE